MRELKTYLAYGFFALALLCVTALCALDRAKIGDFLTVLGVAASCLGWYHAQAPERRAPGGIGAAPPPPGLPLFVGMLAALSACSAPEVDVAVKVRRPPEAAAPVAATQLNLQPVGALSCPSGLVCLSASPAGTLTQTYQGVVQTLLTSATIPDIDASKVTSGVFDPARIPNLDASKITAGTLGVARLPQTLAAGSCTACNLSWNNAGQLTAASNGSSGATLTAWLYNPAARGAALAQAASLGNITTGYRFIVWQSVQLAGVRFYFGTAGTYTVRCRLYANDGTELAVKAVAVSGAGLYTATFTTPVTLTAGGTYVYGCYESSGFYYMGALSGDYGPSGIVQNGHFTLIEPTYADGETANLTTGSWSYRYPETAYFVGE